MILVNKSPIAIVIPVHNGMHHLPQSLRVLRSLDGPPSMVVVVDDGSTDDTASFLDQASDVIAVRGSGSLWWSGAVDVGCRLAIARGAEVLITWNDDNAAASSNCIVRLVEHVRAYGGCASPVTVQKCADGSRPILSAGGRLSWRGGGLRLREAGSRFIASAETVTCDWLGGIALAFGAELFTTLDGFDARRFPQYYGDSDFTLRAKYEGAQIAVLYSCWVVNDISRSGMRFENRVSLREFVHGLFSLKSSYQLKSTTRFFFRHCPLHVLPLALSVFYLRYLYATVKTWR
jgi:N-acetylglucosaminyl-diphospho-decaprenol L-rhamnosyltransferase